MILPEDYPENASHSEQTDNTAHDVLHDAPDGAQRFSRSTLSSSRATNPPVVSSHNHLYGGAISLDNQSDIQNFHQGATWNLGASEDVANNIQPTTSSGNVDHAADVNVFSWPLLGSDSDWQVDFDMALTAEATNTTSSTSSNTLTELDMCQSLTKLTQGPYSVDSTGELSEYLSMDKKVRSDATFLAQLM